MVCLERALLGDKTIRNLLTAAPAITVAQIILGLLEPLNVHGCIKPDPSTKRCGGLVSRANLMGSSIRKWLRRVKTHRFNKWRNAYTKSRKAMALQMVMPHKLPRTLNAALPCGLDPDVGPCTVVHIHFILAGTAGETVRPCYLVNCTSLLLQDSWKSGCRHTYGAITLEFNHNIKASQPFVRLLIGGLFLSARLSNVPSYPP